MLKLSALGVDVLSTLWADNASSLRHGASAKSLLFGTGQNFHRKSYASFKFVLSEQLCEWQPTFKEASGIFTILLERLIF